MLFSETASHCSCSDNSAGRNRQGAQALRLQADDGASGFYRIVFCVDRFPVHFYPRKFPDRAVGGHGDGTVVPDCPPAGTDDLSGVAAVEYYRSEEILHSPLSTLYRNVAVPKLLAVGKSNDGDNL